MANTFKNIRKKLRRKRLMAEKARLEKKQANSAQSQDYQSRLSRHRRETAKKIILSAALVIGAVLLVTIYIQKRSYHDYKILQTSEQEDIVSTKYTEMDGKILRYSPDGVSLVNKKLEAVWAESYQMQNPIADVCGSRAVIADRDGTSMVFLDKSGMTGSVTTSYAIVKAKVSRSGLVAAILDGGDNTWINFYSTDGSLIA